MNASDLTPSSAEVGVVVTRIADPPLDLPGMPRMTVRFVRAPAEGDEARQIRVVSPVLPGDPAPSRIAEYIAGRYCAETALARLLGRRVPVGRRVDRAPVWPPGVVGSIAHCNGVAVAVVATCDSAAGVGVDVETAAPARWDEETFARITSERERAALEPAELELAHLAAVVFSAKESAYKCVNPLTGARLTFRDVRIGELGARTFAVTLPEGVSSLLRKDVRLHGSYGVVGDLVHTAVWIGARGAQTGRDGS